MIDVALSVLELLSTDTGHPTVNASGIVDVAQVVERYGYKRIWYAEHHNSESMVPFPPAVVVARVASATSTIRVGSGGVLAVNHAPVSLAEQFEALTGFFPGRVDLGIGRGPGTFVEATARALRHGRDPATEDEYRANVAEILRLVRAHPSPAEPWLLASSPVGATVAATFGLPMAFAHHLRPQSTAESVERYHLHFKPSEWSDTPRLMLAVQTVCAETDARAAALARPADILRARFTVKPARQPMLDVVTAAEYQFTAAETEVVEAFRAYVAQGTPEMVRARLREMGDQFGADEIILYTPIIDAEDRARSYKLVTLG